MEIAGIKKIVGLIQKVDCTNYAMITDTAKEMGVKKTALMEFIDNNPKLFDLVEVAKKGKTIGLGISRVYLSAEENPKTEEWLEKKKAEWENKIHVGEQTYYGQHEYFYIPMDDPNSTNDAYRKEGMYRNTPEKIKFLEEKGIIKKVSGGYGGLSDYYNTVYYPYGDKEQKALEDIGWTTDFNK